MGLLIDGQWHDQWYDTDKSGGRFERFESIFRNWITPDGAPGPNGEGGFAAEAGRYHLYVSYSCPWAHRTLIYRHLMGLEDAISVSMSESSKHREGWLFYDEGAMSDPLNHISHLHQLYTKAVPDYSGRVTVPAIWDKERQTIVNNESSEIIRMFNTAFGADGPDLYPEALRAEIDAINERVYASLNNGVYRCGFASSQQAYDAAIGPLFETLDWLEECLSRRRYLLGDALTEADWRLYPTLLRFDIAYHGNFKCNIRRLIDFPNLWGYTRELHQMEGIAATSNLEQIKTGYYTIEAVNHTQIVPAGPAIDFMAPHGRG